jgi:hypothetical protein
MSSGRIYLIKQVNIAILSYMKNSEKKIGKKRKNSRFQGIKRGVI